MRAKYSTQDPDRCNRDDQRLAKSPTRQGDLRYLLPRSDLKHHRLVVIQLQDVYPHPGTDVMTTVIKYINVPINVGLDRLHKHIIVGSHPREKGGIPNH